MENSILAWKSPRLGYFKVSFQGGREGGVLKPATLLTVGKHQAE